MQEGPRSGGADEGEPMDDRSPTRPRSRQQGRSRRRSSHVDMDGEPVERLHDKWRSGVIGSDRSGSVYPSAVLEDGEYNTKEIQLISPEVQATVGNILFVSAYGHKTIFEARMHSAYRLVFPDLALKTVSDKIEDFHASWKDYR